MGRRYLGGMRCCHVIFMLKEHLFCCLYFAKLIIHEILANVEADRFLFEKEKSVIAGNDVITHLNRCNYYY